MSFGQFVKFIYMFRGLIGRFWPGFEVQSETTTVLDSTKSIRYTGEFSVSEDPNNEDRVIVSITTIDGGTF